MDAGVLIAAARGGDDGLEKTAAFVKLRPGVSADETIARAIMSRWRCPPERPAPPSPMMVCIPIGMAWRSFSNPASLAASQASSIE